MFERRRDSRMSSHRGDAGASAVEFALVLPLLVLFLFGTITFGLAFARIQAMEAVAREGARYASIGRTVTYAQVNAHAQGTAAGLIRGQDVQVRVNGTTAERWCTSPDSLVRVTVQIRPDRVNAYALPVPLWGSLVQNYRAEGVFRCESRHTS
jgi:Flp pilus assembly protein TadG